LAHADFARTLDYVIRGKMIGRFALTAWPAEYGNSGAMTFLVNYTGRVYQKDLGGLHDETRAAHDLVRSRPDLEDGKHRSVKALAFAARSAQFALKRSRKFPVSVQEIPVHCDIFPVKRRREFPDKSLQHNNSAPTPNMKRLRTSLMLAPMHFPVHVEQVRQSKDLSAM
jgi:Protein of unknown function (DUF2950)